MMRSGECIIKCIQLQVVLRDKVNLIDINAPPSKLVALSPPLTCIRCRAMKSGAHRCAPLASTEV